MAGIIVKETVVEKDPTIISEVVALPGIKGEKGDPFTYDDFTPEQIAELQRPATEAAETANNAALNANKAAQNINALGEQLIIKESQRENAESLRKEAEEERETAEMSREQSFSQMQTTLKGLISDTNTAVSNATTAAENAENAASEANTAATSANEAAANANQVAQNVDNRVTAVEEKASQSYDNLAAIQSSNDKNVNKIYIDKETNISYRYDLVLDTYVSIIADKAIKDFNGNVINETYATKEEVDENYLKNEEAAEMCFRELFTSVGGKYENGKYSYFGIELTYDEAKIAYNYPLISYGALENYNYPPNASIVPILVSKLPGLGAGWAQNRTFEGLRVRNLCIFNESTILYIINSAKRTFCGGFLNNIINIIDFKNVSTNIDSDFFGSNKENLKIRNLSVNIDISLSNGITYNTIKYLVDNAANTSAITVTVHPTTYGYLTGTIQPTEQVGGTTEEWQAIVTTAAEKQITFATTE